MPKDSEDADYLARPKPQRDDESFKAVVREAFALEHGFTKDYQIAESLGISKGAVAQMFGKHPRALKAETIKAICDRFRSKSHRKNIVKAWEMECFGEEVYGSSERLIGDEVTDATMRRIDRLVREARLDRALRITNEALEVNRNPDFRMPLLTKAYFLNQRLDRAGEAMAIAREIFEWGRTDSHQGRMARALYMRARILRGMDRVPTEMVEGTIQDGHDLLEMTVSTGKGEWDAPPEHKSFEAEHRALVLNEQEQQGGLEDYLREMLRSVEGETAAARSRTEKFKLLQMQARIRLALREPFKAEELLGASFEQGEYRSLNAHEMSSIIAAKIKAVRGDIDGAIEYYKEVLRLCEEQRDLYHFRLAQTDLARLLARRFPPS